jgi:cation transport ATPase
MEAAEIHAGKGVQAELDGQRYRLGSANFVSAAT